MLKCRSLQQCTSASTEDEVWCGALEEVDKGWLIGPMSEEHKWYRSMALFLLLHPGLDCTNPTKLDL